MSRAALPRRRFLLEASLASLSGCLARRSPEHFDAVVARDDTGLRGPRHASLAAAIAAAPADGRAAYRIALGCGSWDEKLVVDKPNIHLVGAHRDICRLGSDRAAGQRRADGRPWGTRGCGSVIVRAPGFRARGLTFENRFDYRAHLRQPVLETVGANGAQAVAHLPEADGQEQRGGPGDAQEDDGARRPARLDERLGERARGAEGRAREDEGEQPDADVPAHGLDHDDLRLLGPV